MEVADIVILLKLLGPPAIKLITGLIAAAEAKGAVTLAEWNKLNESDSLTARDHALAALKAANIDPNSAQGIAFLSAIPL